MARKLFECQSECHCSKTDLLDRSEDDYKEAFFALTGYTHYKHHPRYGEWLQLMNSDD